MNLSAALRTVALGVVFCSSAGCAPEPTPAAHSAATPASTPISASATAAPPAGGCHVRSDCPKDQLCVYDHPGCDAPVGKCEPFAMTTCTVALPIATCSGEPYHACAQGQSELPYYSRSDGKPGYAFDAAHAIPTFYGTVGEVVVYHAPDELQSDVAMDAKRLETSTSTEKRGATSGDATLAATEILSTIVAKRDPKEADLRWEMVLLNRQGKVVATVSMDKFGERGEINGERVVFAHPGALVALRVLAAKMAKRAG